MQRVLGVGIGALAMVGATAPSSSASCPLPPAGWQPATGVPGNRVSNPGAEDGTAAPWTASDGTVTALYGDDLRGPGAGFAAARNFGERYFGFPPGGGTLSQDIASPGLADDEITFGATTMGRDTADRGSVRLLALDADGVVVAEQGATGLGPAPTPDGAVIATALAGRVVLPPATRSVRIVVAAGAGVDGAFITGAEYGSVPTSMCGSPAAPPPTPAPPTPAVSAPERPRPAIRVTAVDRTVVAGRRLSIRVRHAARGDRLEGRWTRGARRYARRAPIRFGVAALRAPRRAGSYRLRLRVDGVTLEVVRVRVARPSR